jgi:TldD protein
VSALVADRPLAGVSLPIPIAPRLDTDEALRTLTRLVELVRTACGDASRVRGQWVEFDQWVCVARGDGPAREDRRGRKRLRIDVQLEGAVSRSSASIEQVVTSPRDVSAEALAERLARRAAERLDAEAPAGRACPVVFAPGVGGLVVHEIVGHGLEGDTVLRGASALATRTEDAGSREVTVIDDPRSGSAGWRIDDEGEEAKSADLLREGRVCGLLHDHASARSAGVRPTGHGRRSSFREPVRPRMGCTFLAPGPMDPHEVVASVREGIHVHRMEGAGMDARTGESFFRVSDADRIVRGRIDRPLGAFLLRLDAHDALSTLDHVASDLAFDACIGSCVRDGQPLPTTVGAPTFRIGMARVITL